MNPSQLLLDTLKRQGFDFFASVPCKLLADFLHLLDRDPDVTHVPVTREEEGVGVCVGAWLGGKKPALVCQSSGVGNSINALCSLVIPYQAPLLMVVSHRGTKVEKVDVQKPMGRNIAQILTQLGVYTFLVADAAGLDFAARREVSEMLPAWPGGHAWLIQPQFWEAQRNEPSTDEGARDVEI